MHLCSGGQRSLIPHAACAEQLLVLEAKSRQRRHPSSYLATGAGRLLALEANRGGGAAYLAGSTTSAEHLRAGGQIRAAARHPLPDPDEVAALGVNQGYNATSLTGGGGAWSACAHHRRRLMWWCVVRPPPQFKSRNWTWCALLRSSLASSAPASYYLRRCAGRGAPLLGRLRERRGKGLGRTGKEYQGCFCFLTHLALSLAKRCAMSAKNGPQLS